MSLNCATETTSAQAVALFFQLSPEKVPEEPVPEFFSRAAEEARGVKLHCSNEDASNTPVTNSSGC